MDVKSMGNNVGFVGAGKAQNVPGAPGKAKGVQKPGVTELSAAAKDYLEGLRSKYSNIEFMVAEFSSDEEADEIMASSKSHKEYTALIDPKTLEKMASDAAEASKFEEILDNTASVFDKLKQDLGDSAKEVERFGIAVDGEGNISYTATMKNDASVLFEKMRESSEKQKEEALEAQKKAAQKNPHDMRGMEPGGPGWRAQFGARVEKPGFVTFSASTIEELKQQIDAQAAANRREYLQTEGEKQVGQSFDLKV